MPYELLSFTKSKYPDKKYQVILLNKSTGREITVHFGASGYSDYTENKDPARRELYIQRHKAREDWTDPTTAGFWAKHILWGDTPNIQTNLKKTIKKYNL